MKSDKPISSDGLLNDLYDFSLVLGGPLYQFFRKARLSDDSLELVQRRIVVISLFCWLPLLILSALDGRLFNANGSIPFLFDVDVHVKFLVVIPLLNAAELVVHRRMRYLVKQFVQRKIIPENEMLRFDNTISSTYGLRNSKTAEIFLVALVYIVGIMIVWRSYTSLQTATWYSTASDDGSKLLPAGLWYGYVSLPIFQFLLLRWYFRLFIWIRFLWKVSRIKLNLVPMHPDKMGGIGFLSATVFAFLPLISAHGAMLAGQIANRIFYAGAKLTDFKVEIAAVVIILMILIIGPLFVFSAKLELAKRTGKREFSAFAMKYVREFDFKWLRGGAPQGEPFIGSSDIQSLADLGNSYDIISRMHFIPVSKEVIFQLVAAVLVPMIPLLLTMMPLGELLKKFSGIFF